MFREKGILKNFATFTGKHLKLQTLTLATLLKRDCNTGVFLPILSNFSEQLFIEHLRWQLLISVLLNDYVKAFLNSSLFGLYVWSFSCFRQKRRMRDLDRTGQINMRETKVETTVSYYGLLTRFMVLVSFCALENIGKPKVI